MNDPPPPPPPVQANSPPSKVGFFGAWPSHPPPPGRAPPASSYSSLRAPPPSPSRDALQGEQGRRAISRAAAKAVTGGWTSGCLASAGGSATAGGQLAAAGGQLAADKNSWNGTDQHPDDGSPLFCMPVGFGCCSASTFVPFWTDRCECFGEPHQTSHASFSRGVEPFRGMLRRIKAGDCCQYSAPKTGERRGTEFESRKGHTK